MSLDGYITLINNDMKSNNLRIGNLVGVKKTAIVADHCDYENAYFEIEELRCDVVIFNGSSTGEYYNDLKGIKLNDGLLSLYGFKRNGPCVIRLDSMLNWLSLKYADGYYYPIYGQRPEMSNQDDQILFMNRIEYLHELQNLYFALTGTELDLKRDE